MRTLLLNVLSACLLIMLTSCASPYRRVLSVEYVSMTARPLTKKSEKRLESLGRVTSRVCEESIDEDDGLFDRVILKAQKRAGADYIKEPDFYANGDGCVKIKGEAVKLPRKARKRRVSKN